MKVKENLEIEEQLLLVACVEICFLKKEFINLTANIILHS